MPERACDTLAPWVPNPANLHEVSALLLLGIDIGGTKLALALGDERGVVRRRFRRPMESTADPAADVARLAEDCRQLLRAAGVAREEVAAIGVSAPGPVDVESGCLVDPPNLVGWGTVPLASWLEAELGGPVALENDANAAALAEWRFGAGRGFANLAYLTMSTGIGGGLILDGRLYRGRRCAAGEIGHIPLEADGPRCACGLRGCFEALAGGAAWARRLQQIAPAESAVVALAGGRAHATPEHVVAAARAGDAFALAELERWCGIVARGLSVVAFTLAPERIILGTIAVAAGEELCFAPLRARVKQLVWPLLADGMGIVPAALGESVADLAGLCAALCRIEAGEGAEAAGT